MIARRAQHLLNPFGDTADAAAEFNLVAFESKGAFLANNIGFAHEPAD